MKSDQNANRTLLSTLSRSLSLSSFAYLLAGLLISFVYTHYPWKLTVMVLGALGLGILTFFQTEFSLYLLFISLIITTDCVSPETLESTGHFVIQEMKIPGLPSILNVWVVFVFFIYFSKLYFLEKRTSLVPFKYLAIYLMVLVLALMKGATHPKATSDLLRLEFMKMLFPVLCFYTCVNVFNDYKKIQMMIWVLFGICVVKSTILDVYYLAGRGFPFGGLQIVSYDTGELMAFIVMLSYGFMMIAYRRVVGAKSWLLGFLSFPMLFALIFSFRRGHWLGMLFSMGLLYLWSPREKKARVINYLFRLAVIIVPMTAILMILPFQVGPKATIEDSVFNMLVKRFSSIFDPAQSSNKHHLFESIQTMKDIMQSPLLGLGLASEHSPVPEELGDWIEELQPLKIVHNTFVYMWMKTGFLGFVFFIWCCFRYAREVVHYQKAYRYSEWWPVAASIGSAMGIWFVMFMTGPVPFYFHQTYLIALLSGMMTSIIRLEKLRYGPAAMISFPSRTNLNNS